MRFLLFISVFFVSALNAQKSFVQSQVDTGYYFSMEIQPDKRPAYQYSYSSERDTLIFSRWVGDVHSYAKIRMSPAFKKFIITNFIKMDREIIIDTAHKAIDQSFSVYIGLVHKSVIKQFDISDKFYLDKIRPFLEQLNAFIPDLAKYPMTAFSYEPVSQTRYHKDGDFSVSLSYDSLPDRNIAFSKDPKNDHEWTLCYQNKRTNKYIYFERVQFTQSEIELLKYKCIQFINTTFSTEPPYVKPNKHNRFNVAYSKPGLFIMKTIMSAEKAAKNPLSREIMELINAHPKLPAKFEITDQ